MKIRNIDVSTIFMTLVILVSLYVTHAVDDMCPSECVCRGRGVSVLDCNAVNLTYIPEQIPNNTNILYFMDNNLEVINETDFLELYNVTIVRLDNNNISDIHPESFVNMQSLHTLFLTENRLTKFDLNLRNLTSLRVLRINNNMLVSIKDGAFDGLVNLTILALGYNELTTISVSLWKDLENLEILRLEHNKLTTFGGMQNLAKLRILYLSYNYITSIYASDLPNPSSLEVLRLEYNLINYLDPQHDSVVLRKLILFGNPLDCSCKLYLFALWINDTKPGVVLGDRCNVTDEQIRLIDFEYCTEPSNVENSDEVGLPVAQGDNMLFIVIAIIISSVIVLACLLMCCRVRNNEETSTSSSATRDTSVKMSKRKSKGEKYVI